MRLVQLLDDAGNTRVGVVDADGRRVTLLTGVESTYALAGADSLILGVIAAGLIGFGMGAEADVTPYILSRYLGLRSFAMLYGFTWTAYAIAGAVGPILMGRAFDATGSYTTLLTRLAIGTFLIAALMLLMPGYDRAFRPAATGAALTPET